jgi:SAM-dependent methyltransferase
MLYEDHKVREEELAQEQEVAEVMEAQTEEGRHVINQFYHALPAMADVKAWYGGFTPEGYNEWARCVNFTEPYHIIDQCVKEESTGGLSLPRTAICMDIGSGTGIVGQAMQNAGFINLHALDVSTNFLDAVRERGFYKEHHNFFLGRGVDQFPAELKNYFDCITASGVWMPGHMPNAALDDVHAALKVGGVLVTAMRNTMWCDGVEEGYKEKIMSLIDTGKFEIIKKDEFYRGTENGTGLFAK